MEIRFERMGMTVQIYRLSGRALQFEIGFANPDETGKLSR